MLAQMPLDELKLGIVLLAPRRRRLELVLDLLHPILEECCASLNKHWARRVASGSVI